MISCGWSNRTPWDSPREMDEDDLERHIEGHIHESRGAIKIGKTLCINPGSEYADGVPEGIKKYRLPSG